MMGVEDLPQMKSLSPGLPLSPAKYNIQQDMDLIEVLWKQDVDLGFSLDLFNPPKSESGDSKVVPVEEDDVEKLKALEALKKEPSNGSIKSEEDNESSTADDPWAGLAYTIDLETGPIIVIEHGFVEDDDNC